MQQKIDYGVEVVFGTTLYAGKCLLQVFKNNTIGYKYSQQDAQIQVKAQGEGWLEAPLLHGQCCPCEGKDLKPRNEQFSKIRLATVAMLCDKDSYFLITRRHSQMKTFPKAWVFPGGMVEKDQQIESECLREVLEETGIDASIMLDSMRLKVFYESIYPTKLEVHEYPLKQTLCMFYEVKLNQSFENINVKIQESEVDDFKWIHKTQLLEIMDGKNSNQEFLEMSGIYPNQYESGIGEGHIRAFKYCYLK